MHCLRTITLLSLLVIPLVRIGTVSAGDGCCAHCGCQCECRKICRLECTEKKITTVCWTYQCEDFCLSGPNCPGCAHCDWACDDCSTADDPVAEPKFRYWREWIPSRWAKVHTKKKLMKKLVTKTVPSYKWVVEDVCARCEAGSQPDQVSALVEIPPAPARNAATIIADE